MLYREIIAVYSEIHTKYINKLCELNVELLHVKPVGPELHIKIQSVPHNKHSPSQL